MSVETAEAEFISTRDASERIRQRFMETFDLACDRTVDDTVMRWFALRDLKASFEDEVLGAESLYQERMCVAIRARATYEQQSFTVFL